MKIKGVVLNTVFLKGRPALDEELSGAALVFAFAELASLRIQTPNYTNGRKAQEIISGGTQQNDFTINVYKCILKLHHN